MAEWELTPSLSRCVVPYGDADVALQIEHDLLAEFKSEARVHLPTGVLPTGGGLLEWWALMQHHGAPTRLLDWTKSLYVAAYFAVVDNWNDDGAIWLFHSKVLARRTIEKHGAIWFPSDIELRRQSADDDLYIWPPSQRSDRMITQQGVFTVSLSALSHHDATIHQGVSKHTDEGGLFLYQKLIIPTWLKPIFLRQLRQMNVTANSLFPGIDGLGRSLAENARLSAGIRGNPVQPW